MKTFIQFNEMSNVGCTVFFKVYFKLENIYNHLDILDKNRIDYDISYHNKFIKIDAYAYTVSEYNFLISIEFKINKKSQELINPNMSLDNIRSIVKSDKVWTPTSKEELPYLSDTNKFNL